MISSRQERVAVAWADAYKKIGGAVDLFCAKHGPPPNCIDMIREYAPGAADRIERAEKASEEASVEWANGGPGGVQVKIDAWIMLWLDGLQMVSDAR